MKKIKKLEIFTSIFHVLFITLSYISALLLFSGYNFLGLWTLSQFIDGNKSIIHNVLIFNFIGILILEIILMMTWLILKRRNSEKLYNKTVLQKYILGAVIIIGLIGTVLTVIFIGEITGNWFKGILYL